MERRGFAPDALIARSASITSAALQPLSLGAPPQAAHNHVPACLIFEAFDVERVRAPRDGNSEGRDLPARAEADG